MNYAGVSMRHAKAVAPAPVVQQNRVAEVVTKPRPSSKKRDSEWLLSY